MVGCRRASSSTLLMAVVAISLLLTLDRPVLAHARHVKSPSSTSTGERPSSTEDAEVWQGTTSSRKLGAGHTKNTATVNVEKGTAAGEGAVGASVVVGRGGNDRNSPASSSAEKLVVVARDGPRPHPKKHN
ncbi:hypothetical protein U9M48_022980 [Paspalum notatum var. saurae]|uniref:Uncharacterized protein n=1 Tax=Paspalum notatum var. saurae TaxID=547442 RepID=A0AAQ3WVP5_PASNO